MSYTPPRWVRIAMWCPGGWRFAIRPWANRLSDDELEAFLRWIDAELARVRARWHSS